MSTSENGNYRLNLELSILKFEVEAGDKDWVEKMADKFLPSAMKAATKLRGHSLEVFESSQQLSLFDETDTVTTTTADTAPAHEDTPVSLTNPENNQQISLCEFYQKLSVERQGDIVASIAYWRKHYLNLPNVDQEMFMAGMKELAYHSVETPDSETLNNQIQNVRRYAKYIYKVEHGMYAITSDGEKRILSLMVKPDQKP